MPRYLRSLILASMGFTFFCHIGHTIHQKSKLESETESEIEREIENSTIHWTELRSTCDSAIDQKAKNMEIFKTLHTRCPHIFESRNRNKKVPMGMKLIAKGAQAEIFEDIYGKLVVYKVFKHKSSLQDLQKQWPDEMFEHLSTLNASVCVCSMETALLCEDGRLAFKLPKYWGDLRTLMDRRMHRNNNQRPPFTKAQVKQIMFDIATGMLNLHQHNILHRDLKASNVLIAFIGATDNALMLGDVDNAYFMRCHVADFECSVGVVGTAFWRAPEILLALQNHNVTSNTFTEMVDVYSYAMTYYEVLTGYIPFKDRRREDYSWVLDGNKPELPDHVGPLTRKLLVQCWDLDPLKRPTFKSIQKQLEPETNILKLETSVSERLEGLIAELLAKLEFEFNSHGYGLC
jgi:serine/threonine protein kinase